MQYLFLGLYSNIDEFCSEKTDDCQLLVGIGSLTLGFWEDKEENVIYCLPLELAPNCFYAIIDLLLWIEFDWLKLLPVITTHKTLTRETRQRESKKKIHFICVTFKYFP